MKNSILFLIILFCTSCNKKNQNESIITDPLIENNLQILLETREYFKLRSDLEKYGERISDNKKQYFHAFVESAFNQYPESIIRINSLLNSQSSFLLDSERVELMLLLRDNYFKTFQYEKSAQAGREVLKKYKYVLGDRSDDVENTLVIHEGLASIPPQHIDLKKVTLTWKPNEIGLIEIPIQTRHSDFQIVFDTRAHISTVTQGFAKKLGLKMLDLSYEESSGITGKKFQSGLGIADSLYIGDILVQHAVFQVLPDEVLHFPSINLSLHGILGFPVITQLKEIHICQNGDFIISPVTRESDLRNLAFDGSTTVVSLKSDDDTLSFHFDTGATASELYSTYFDKYRASVIERGKLETVESGGAGGSVKIEVYSLPTVGLSIRNKKIILNDIGVRTTPAYKGQKYFGNIGQDFINQFDEMILNFESMYIDFK